MKLTILVIDDDESILKTFKLRLKQWGHEVFLASDGPSGMGILSRHDCQVVVTDLKMPQVSGEEIVKRVKEKHPEVEVLVITGHASVEAAVEVMKSGAFDFITKPINYDHLRILMDKIGERLSLTIENRELKNRVGDLTREVEKKYRLHNLVGKSEPMQSVFGMIAKLAPLESTVTIYGETGTGKELVARAIHHNSLRKSGPMITVDCGTLAETLLESELFGHEKGAFTGAQRTMRGRFEQADGGTILLDEISNASSAVQKKLLRLIQEKSFQRIGGEALIKVNTRIIAATNQDLGRLVTQGKFRRDLFYRLNVVPIRLPPLRERKEDMALLARHFLNTFIKEMGLEPIRISPEAIEQLERHPWPGNVRELRNVMERIAIMSSSGIVKNIPFLEDAGDREPLDFTSVSLEPPLNDQIALLELSYLKLALETYHGRLKEVSEKSGLNPRTLYRKMKLYDLEKQDFR